jgi:hypothetical protein
VKIFHPSLYEKGQQYQDIDVSFYTQQVSTRIKLNFSENIKTEAEIWTRWLMLEYALWMRGKKEKKIQKRFIEE